MSTDTAEELENWVAAMQVAKNSSGGTKEVTHYNELF